MIKLEATLTLILSLILVVCIAVVPISTDDGKQRSIHSFLIDASPKEIRTNFKIFLTNMKIRPVPLAKKRSERLLSKLYKEERILKEEIEELEKNLNRITNNMARGAIKVLEVKGDLKKSSDPSRPRAVVTQLTTSRIDEWKTSLEAKRRQFLNLRAKIMETKNIIKDPENYISIPSNYGQNPEEQREREKEVLIADRKNMQYRADIIQEKATPSWLTDDF